MPHGTSRASRAASPAARHPGQALAEARRRDGKTLNSLAAATGVAASTISRIENELISPTYGVLAKLAAGLGMRWSDLIGEAQDPGPDRLMSLRTPVITRASAALCVATARGDNSWHAAGLRKKRMEPTIFEPVCGGSRALEMHDGEEFMLVLSGEVILLMEGVDAVRLTEGDSAYLDAAVPHAVFAEHAGARVLSVLAPYRC